MVLLPVLFDHDCVLVANVCFSLEPGTRIGFGLLIPPSYNLLFPNGPQKGSRFKVGVQGSRR